MGIRAFQEQQLGKGLYGQTDRQTDSQTDGQTVDIVYTVVQANSNPNSFFSLFLFTSQLTLQNLVILISFFQR